MISIDKDNTVSDKNLCNSAGVKSMKFQKGLNSKHIRGARGRLNMT